MKRSAIPSVREIVPSSVRITKSKPGCVIIFDRPVASHDEQCGRQRVSRRTVVGEDRDRLYAVLDGSGGLRVEDMDVASAVALEIALIPARGRDSAAVERQIAEVRRG